MDIYPTLKAKAKNLELGYSAGGDSEDDIVVAKKEVNDAIAKDTHGFLPKSQGPKMGQGVCMREGGREGGRVCVCVRGVFLLPFRD